jgi:hypothetical protein
MYVLCLAGSTAINLSDLTVRIPNKEEKQVLTQLFVRHPRTRLYLGFSIICLKTSVSLCASVTCYNIFVLSYVLQTENKVVSLKHEGSVKVEEQVLRNSSHHKLCAGFDYECGALFEVMWHCLYLSYVWSCWCSGYDVCCTVSRQRPRNKWRNNICC